MFYTDVGGRTKKACLPGGTKEVKLLVWTEAQLAQAAAEVNNKFFIVLVGNKEELSEFEVLLALLNLFCLTVDVLLNLFSFLVELHELAVANGGVIRVKTGAAADDVEYDVDAFGGRVDEAVLIFDMPMGDRLARDFGVARCFDSERGLVHLV